MTTIRDALLWQASSNGRKYFSAVMIFAASFFGRGSVPEDGLSDDSAWPPFFNSLFISSETKLIKKSFYI